jgi:hypothetical protein
MSSQNEAAEALREQAASCRSLALRARTAAGSSALNALAEHFDAYARRSDPWGEQK